MNAPEVLRDIPDEFFYRQGPRGKVPDFNSIYAYLLRVRWEKSLPSFKSICSTIELGEPVNLSSFQRQVCKERARREKKP